MDWEVVIIGSLFALFMGVYVVSVWLVFRNLERRHNAGNNG